MSDRPIADHALLSDGRRPAGQLRQACSHGGPVNAAWAIAQAERDGGPDRERPSG